jgi:ABC-type sugar transport system permease subunit
MTHRKLTPNLLKHYAFGYSLIAPAFIILFVFFVWPLIQGVLISFHTGFGLGGDWAGLKNYANTLTDPRFWNSLKVSLIFTVSIVFFSGFLGLFLAIALIRKPQFYVIYLSAAFMPYITTPVIGALIWSNMLADPYGIIDVILSSLGRFTIPWLKQPFIALLSIIFIQVWYTMGYNAVLFMAGLEAIPNSYFEAADLEGCGFFQKLFFITFPLLIPTIIFVTTVSTLYGFINSFVLAKLVTGGGPFEATNVLMSYIFEFAFDRFDLGRSNAVTMIAFFLFMGIALLQFNIQTKKFIGLH